MATLSNALKPNMGSFAVLLTALEGDQPDIDELDEEQFRQWGVALGRLHASLANCPEELRRPNYSWSALIDRIAKQCNGGPEAIRHEARAIRVALAELPITPATYGMIHTDFEPDNLIWQQSGIAMLDFDEYTESWYAADIAKALTDRLETGASFDDPLLDAFVAGYRTMFPLTEAQLATVPLMLRLRKLHDCAVLKRTCDLPSDFVGA